MRRVSQLTMRVIRMSEWENCHQYHHTLSSSSQQRYNEATILSWQQREGRMTYHHDWMTAEISPVNQSPPYPVSLILTLIPLINLNLSHWSPPSGCYLSTDMTHLSPSHTHLHVPWPVLVMGVTPLMSLTLSVTSSSLHTHNTHMLDIQHNTDTLCKWKVNAPCI